jgi:hypothetical protein
MRQQVFLWASSPWKMCWRSSCRCMGGVCDMCDCRGIGERQGVTTTGTAQSWVPDMLLSSEQQWGRRRKTGQKDLRVRPESYMHHGLLPCSNNG